MDNSDEQFQRQIQYIINQLKSEPIRDENEDEIEDEQDEEDEYGEEDEE